jgi:aspartyl protease family protein
MNEQPQNPESKVGKQMIWLAALGMLGGFYLVFSQLQRETAPLSSVNEQGLNTVVLSQDRSGHYQVEGLINGQKVDFLVDTGATTVALPAATARAIGLDFGPQVMVNTANGPTKAWMTRIDRVTVGGIERRNVSASITDSDFGGVLLGMSFLKHYNLQQRDDELIITEVNPGTQR